ncbi:MAG: HAMP domain-containing histidine kinase [Gorillibacterium sp.]|nr:HAMP domain-containing histidine kinase [Gorillibacterium sp.]
MLNSIFMKWLTASIAITISILLILTISISWLVQRDFYQQGLHRLNQQAEAVEQAYEQLQTGAISQSAFQAEMKQIKKNADVEISIIGKRVNYLKKDVYEVAVRPNIKNWISYIGKDNRIQKIARFQNHDHEKMLIVGFPLKAKDQVVAAAFIYSPITEVKHLAQPIRRSIWFVALAVAGPLIILLWIATRRFVKPIQEMSKAAVSVSNGNFSSRVKVTGEDEIARLGISFNRMAERIEHVEDQRKRFIMEIAHELRTPLTSIRGTLQAVSEGILSEDEQKEFITISLKESLRMGNLINHIGELSAFEEHQIVFDYIDVNMVELVEQTVLQLRPKADALGMKLQINADQDENITLSADPARIRQVLINLIGNALDHNKAGITVVIHLCRNQHKISLIVQDNGQGIAPEHLPHLFERLYKAESSRTSTGSGLGLTICRHIIHAHGGTIQAISDPGKGTVFKVLLPLVRT